jgi:hypothetical protein
VPQILRSGRRRLSDIPDCDHDHTGPPDRPQRPPLERRSQSALPRMGPGLVAYGADNDVDVCVHGKAEGVVSGHSRLVLVV